MNTLSITGGTLDLADNDLIVASTPLTTVAGYIRSAYNSGGWNGGGLTGTSAQSTSSGNHKTALAYATAASLGIASFDGQSVSGGTALVRYTLAGDSNLDGIVNAQDFDALASHYGVSGGGVWTQGDFNYDGTVNTTDFNLLAANFNAALPAPALGTLEFGGLPSGLGLRVEDSRAVPEPCLATIALTLLFAHRRGRTSPFKARR